VREVGALTLPLARALVDGIVTVGEEELANAILRLLETEKARIIERGLVQAGRLVRLVVVLRDRPGALARVTTVVAEERGNVVHIAHDRAFSRWVAIGETEVELTLETSGRAHAEALIARLRAAGYRVEERTG
jgi:threonine dehydratase